MPDYTDWDSLCQGVKDQVEPILRDYVAPVVTQHIMQHMRSDVYDAFTPQRYVRRHSLLDPNSYENEMLDDSTMLIYSTAEANKPLRSGYSWSNAFPGAFSYFINGGVTGTAKWYGMWRGGFARPAVTNAQKTLRSNQAVPYAMQQGVKELIG